MEERELLTFLIGVTVIIVTLLQRRKLNLFPELRLPFVAFCLLTLSTLANLLDNTQSFEVFQFLEHALYALAAAVIAWWVFGLERKKSS